MRPFHRLARALVLLALPVAGGTTAWLSSTASAASPRQVQPNGVNFTIHSIVDPNYCVEDTPAPANPASQASMSQCAVRDGQHWTFADAADGSIVIIGGNTGNCLDFTAKVVSPVSMTPCTFGNAEQFRYTGKGQIELAAGTKCLEAAQATQDATLSIVKCKKGVGLQTWSLGH